MTNTRKPPGMKSTPSDPSKLLSRRLLILIRKYPMSYGGDNFHVEVCPIFIRKEDGCRNEQICPPGGGSSGEHAALIRRMRALHPRKCSGILVPVSDPVRRVRQLRREVTGKRLMPPSVPSHPECDRPRLFWGYSYTRKEGSRTRIWNTVHHEVQKVLFLFVGRGGGNDRFRRPRMISRPDQHHFRLHPRRESVRHRIGDTFGRASREKGIETSRRPIVPFRCALEGQRNSRVG